MVAHPTDPQLYVATQDKILVYDADKLIRSFAFPADAVSMFSDLIWYQGDLYVGHGGKIYRLQAGSSTFTEFAEIPLGGAGTPPGRFCVSAGEVFLYNGQAINIQSRTTRSWISRGTLTSEQNARATVLAASMGAGIHCSATAVSPLIYAPAFFNNIPTIRAITPVPSSLTAFARSRAVSLELDRGRCQHCPPTRGRPAPQRGWAAAAVRQPDPS